MSASATQKPLPASVICVYCAQLKPAKEMSDEHVVPQALGGNVVPANPFLLKTVCRRCNSVAGNYIDGPFIRSWFTSNHRADNAFRYSDIAVNPILPLTYMGYVKKTVHPNRLCETWLAPAGCTVYHFHRPYPKYGVGTVGRPTNVKNAEIDPGFVIFFVTKNVNPDWYVPIFRSIEAAFRGTQVYCGNGVVHGLFPSVPAELEKTRNKLLQMMSGMIAHQMVVDFNADARFMGKLALGFGGVLLDPSFVTSVDATLLRDFMWAKKPSDRDNLKVLGASVWKSRGSELQEHFKWPPGHTIVVMPVGRKLVINAVFYGEQSALMQISAEPAHWADRIPEEGVVYVLAPSHRKYVGPVSVPEYIQAKLNPNERDPGRPLDALMIEMEAIQAPPPFFIETDEG